MDVKDAAKQKVKYAVELLSHTVSKSIERCVMLGKMNSQNAIECSKFIKLVNDWFDLFNSSSKKIDNRERMSAYGSSEVMKVHNAILNNMSELMRNLRVGGHSSMLMFQKGIIINNQSLPELFLFLKKEYNIEYILTRRLNQDDLERFFGYIRYRGGLYDHPSSLEFKYRLRLSILGNIFFNHYCIFTNTHLKSK